MFIFTFFTFVHFVNLLGRRHEALAFKSAAPLAGSRAFGMLTADSCQFLSDSKSLCWPPPLPSTLPQKSCKRPFGRPMSPSFSILSRLFADRKLIKKQTPQKTSQNLKSRTPDRPNLGFGLAFGSHFGMEFSWNSWFGHNMLKPPKCLYIKHFNGFSTFKISCFSHQNSIKN